MEQNPEKRFFMTVCVSNLDGTIEIPDCFQDSCPTLEEALESAKKEASSGDESLQTYVYECTPKYRVTPVKPHIKKYKT